MSDPDVRELYKLYNIPDAIDCINKVFVFATASGKHQEADWRRPDARNEEHLHMHYANWRLGASDEDHLANFICRALMLLQLRLEQEQH